MTTTKLQGRKVTQNKYILKGADAEIHSDFDQNGNLDYSASERDRRFKRPGAIVLPNLNLSKGPPAGVPGIDLSTKRDADDNKIQGKEDLSDLTPLAVKSPIGPLLADEVLLRVSNDDLKRFRIFLQGAGAPETWSAVFGNGVGNDYLVNFSPNTSWQKYFFMEAVTLAGNPKSKGPNGAAPKSPLKNPAGCDATGKGVIYKRSDDPIYNKIGPGEIWLELIHKKGAKELKNNIDVALFLISPFQLQSNIEPCERIYVTYLEKINHDFVYDLMEACWNAFGAPGSFERDSSIDFVASTPSDLTKPNDTTAGRCNLSSGRIYLIDGAKYNDEWVQDEFEMGYCSAPGDRSFNVVLHCKRNRELSEFVKKELADKNIALFNDLEGPVQDSTDYGGNIEVSPPVLVETKKENKSDAGPGFPAHPKAPFGKIIIGDSKNPDRAGEGLLHDETRDFFKAQVIQPIIPINTSWLGVGHVDEFMSFVPSNTARGSCLLIASVLAMNILLDKTMKIDFKEGRTNFHRGKFESHREMVSRSASGNTILQIFWNSYAEITAEDLYYGDVGKYSQKIRKKFMIPIESRLMRCTGHTGEDVIRIPIYFKPGEKPFKPYGSDKNITVAETVGMVNMQIANKHLFVPKPFGPRMPKGKAVKIVKETLEILKKESVPIKTLSDTGFPFWAWPGLSVDRVALFFTQPDTGAERKELIKKIKNPSYGISAFLTGLVDAKKTEIMNANNSFPAPISTITPGGVFNKWKRLFIPEKTVDVIETYVVSVLSYIGCNVHFVDDWYYHVGWGEAHCATNAKRTPPSEAKLKQKWWEIYDPGIDISYNPKA